MEVMKYLVLILFYFFLANACETDGKDVEYRKRAGTDNYFKEYQEDSLYFREVFEGSPAFMKNRVQTDIYRLSNGSHKTTIIYQDNGQDTSRILSYDTSGILRQAASYKYGSMNGIYQELDTLGSVLIEGNMKNGKMDGIWRRYYPSGEIRSKFTLAGGVMHGTDSVWNKDGELMEAYKYNFGKVIDSYSVPEE